VIATMDRNRELLRQKGSLTAQRIATGFSEDAYRRTVNAIYHSVVASGETMENGRTPPTDPV
jgi:hypothetical protein